jgi:nitrogen fixation NifU-like protein
MPDPAELYQAVIEEHRRRPRHRGPLPVAHRAARRENPACGDVCAIQFQLNPPPSPEAAAEAPAHLLAVGFTGAGCALSQASASMLAAALTGLSVAEARILAGRVDALVRTGTSIPDPTDMGDLAALAAAHAFPARHACALLAWQTALAALAAPRPTETG